MGDVPVRPRVDLDNLELSVALVELKLGAEYAAIVDLGEERPERGGGLADLVEWDRHGRGGIREPRRVHADATPRHHGRDRPAAVDEAVDQDGLRHVSWDPVLEHEGDPGSGSLLDQASRGVPRTDEGPFRAKYTVVALRVRRLEEPVLQILIRGEIKVRLNSE
jgi:hypothetical protein